MWRPVLILLFLFPQAGGPKTVVHLPREGAIGCGPEGVAGGWGSSGAAIGWGPAAAAVGCGSPGAAVLLPPDADGRYAPVFPGWGHYHYPVSTTSDSAQFFFDQGLSLYYSYHLTEAVASFREAALKDSGCAMAYWGEALAMGPYYNIAYTYKMPPEVLPVLEKMNALSSGVTLLGSGVTAKEKDLIAALDQRYSTDMSDSRRPVLNRAYSEAMRRLIGRYPGDNDVKALFIDGVMSEHAWDMWDNKGHPKPWTPELVKYCEEILASDPDHPAALHYHIHLLEASPHPEATLASANRLRALMPGVPHMVHMASHSYQRTGLYAQGVMINDSANAAQRTYGWLLLHLPMTREVIHYDAVQAFCAMNGAMYARAVEAGGKCRKIAQDRSGVVSTNMQFLSSMTLFALVRMGRWQEILDQPVPDRGWIYASLLSEFARGMAYVHLGKMALAQACLDSLRICLADPTLAVRQRPFNAAVKPGTVAEKILEGELLFSAGKADAAMTAFRLAIESEDGMDYLEPNEWPLPARQYAGSILLRLGRPAEAEKMYRGDLVQNPGNGWSLLGLSQCLRMQHKDEAEVVLQRAKTAFAAAEEMPRASVY